MMRLSQAARAVRHSTLCRPAIGHTPSPRNSAPISMASLHPRTIYQRTVNYFNDYPFVKYSILLCAAVLGGSLAFENYSKHKKKRQPQILSLPPHVSHQTLPRPAELKRLRDAARGARRRGEGLVYLVGPPGSGKTELVCQYGQQFIEQTHNFTYRFRITKPAVLHLNGTSPDQLHSSLIEVALCLGVSQPGESLEGGGDLVSLARVVEEKLRANGVPWLLILDNLTPASLPAFQSVFHSSDLDWDWRMGHVMVTSSQPLSEEEEAVVDITSSLDPELALSLLHTVSSSADFSAADPAKLSPLLSSSSSSSLALALAASTVDMYSASLEGEGSGLSALNEFLDLLSERGSEDISETCVRLYVEAATVTQPRMLHVFDLLGSLSTSHPLPASLVDRHLSSVFHRLPPLQPPAIQPPDTPTTQDVSFFAQLKMVLPFGNKTSPQTPSQQTAFDRLHYLRHCPLLSFKKYSREEFELVQVHAMAADELSKHFLKKTAPLLNEAHVKEAWEVFESTAWFKHYRSFDQDKALASYWSSLPGVSGTGVLTREQFKTAPPGDSLEYSEYLHSISHIHRVISSIVSELKLLDDGFSATQYCRYIQPLLTHLHSSSPVSDSDRALCLYGLASVASALAPHSALPLYQRVLDAQRATLGQEHPAVARTLTDMASLFFSREDMEGARNLLESALKIHQSLPRSSLTSEMNIDHGLALTSLAVVVSCVGEKRLSRELLEQALGLYQSLPESGEVSVYQRRLVASTLTDLSQAYLTLGQIVLAQKYVELAMLALPSVYPEGSRETVRALSVAGAVYALLGDKRESQRVGQEAGKTKAKLEKRQFFV